MLVHPLILNHSNNVLPLLLNRQRRFDLKGIDFDTPNNEAFINHIHLSPILAHIEISDSTCPDEWPSSLFQGNIAYFHCYRTGMDSFPIPSGAGAAMYQMIFDPGSMTIWGGLVITTY